MTNYQFDIALGTHRGRKRSTNEDAVAYQQPSDTDTLTRKGILLVLADGVGGLEGGEQASDFAVQRTLELYDSQSSARPVADRLQDTLQQVNRETHRRFDKSATTIVALVLYQSRCVIAHVGDSRAYWRRGSIIQQLTTDHAAQVQTPSGRMKKKLTAAIGHHATVDVDITEKQLQPGDWLCLVTDGVTRYLDDAALLDSLEGNAFSVVDYLLRESYHAGGKDNASAIVVQVGQTLTDDAMLQQLLKNLDTRGIRVTLPDVLPARRPQPAPPAATTPAELPDRKNTANETASDDSGGVSLLLIGLLLVILLVGGGGFWWMSQQADVTAPDMTATPLASPVPEQDATATSTPTASPTLTATPAPTATLPPGVLLDEMRVRFQETATTYVRIGQTTAAFTLDPSQVYRVVDSYEADGTVWYQLLNPDAERRGWIERSQLPDYIIESD